MSQTQNHIDHVALVIDESWSMSRHARDLVRVVDGQVAHLARRTADRGQETRISLYTFNDTVRCRVFDTDVSRVPSLAGSYRPSGRTALIDATIQSQDDLGQTAQMHGDHAFLTFVLTDGEENASRRRPQDLRRCLEQLPAHWTVACLVPNAYGKHEAQSFGFAAGNIAIWDPTTAAGIEEGGSTIQQGIEGFLAGREQGVRGTKTLFSTGLDAVNAATVQTALTPLTAGAYELLPVRDDDYIRQFVEGAGRPYIVGGAYYQLTKTETIQRAKQVAVREKRTGQVFAGPAARDLIGLPDMDVRVKPDHNPEFDVFVQSTSTNRKLIGGTDLLLLR